QQKIAGLEEQQRAAEQNLTEALRSLGAARAAAAELNDKAAAARAAHAALVERATALAADVLRLREAALELEERITSRSEERRQTASRREELLEAMGAGERMLDDDIRALDGLREALRTADEAAGALRVAVDAQDTTIREARQLLEGVRSEVASFDVARATAESDLTHLAQSCADAVQMSLDTVLADVEAMEQAGTAVPDVVAITAEEPEPDEDSGSGIGDQGSANVEPANIEATDPGSRIPDPVSSGSMTAEDAIVALKAKIDRLGPVNMMAIEQFDELETRHTFLTTQRKDLIDSIAQTTEAIRRIDETSKARFAEAFAAIQENFQGTFSTLFGGGRAGLTLLDEHDPLESGIDIVASPPGKRLQSVQLLSGGEKALTAIALMFAIFKY